MVPRMADGLAEKMAVGLEQQWVAVLDKMSVMKMAE